MEQQEDDLFSLQGDEPDETVGENGGAADTELAELRAKVDDLTKALQTRNGKTVEKADVIASLMDEVDEQELANNPKGALAKMFRRVLSEAERKVSESPEAIAMRHARIAGDLARKHPSVHAYLSKPTTRERILAVQKTEDYSDPDVNRNKALLFDAITGEADRRFQRTRKQGDVPGAESPEGAGGTRVGRKIRTRAELLEDDHEEALGQELHKLFKAAEEEEDAFHRSG